MSASATADCPRSATADWVTSLRHRGSLRASRIIRNKWHSLQEILHVEVPHCPLHIVDMEPNRFAIFDLKPDLANLCAIWTLLGATDRHAKGRD